MKRARLTEDGARRIGHPELAGEIIEYDRLHPGPVRCIDNFYYDGRRLDAVLSYAGDEPGVELLDEEQA